MAEEFANPVADTGAFETEADAGAFETEDEDRSRKGGRRGIKGLKGGFDAVKGGVSNITHGATEKMGNASQLTSVKDLMKFADLAGGCARTHHRC